MPPLPVLVAGALVAGAVVAIAFMVHRGSASRQRARRAAWGKPRDDDTWLERVRGYVDGLAGAGEPPRVDERTCRDLDLDRVFRVLDHTSSAVGQQVLYARLRNPSDHPEAIKRFGRLTAGLEADAGLRERVRARLEALTGREPYGLPDLLVGPLPRRRWVYALLPILGVAPLVSLVLAFVWPRALLAFIAALVLNVLIRGYLRPRLGYLAEPFRVVRLLITTGERLAAAVPHECETIVADLSALRPLRRRTWLFLLTAEGAEWTRMIYEELSTLFLVDMVLFVGAIGELDRHRATLRRVFEFVGEIDAAMAMASYRSAGAHWVAPDFAAPGAPLIVEDVVHPLVATPVPNSVRLAPGRGALITGSNMSGKTTLIRAIGVNAILAQSVDLCLATRYAAPPLRVATSIVRFDDVAGGTSYYVDEVRAVLELVRTASGDVPALFLLDEVFRGTNAIERIAAARGVLHHLARSPHFVVAATHDLELVELLADRFDALHFREEIAGGTMTFDYHLRPGASSTRNAIRLLEALGAPPAVISDALTTARALEPERRQPGSA